MSRLAIMDGMTARIADEAPDLDCQSPIPYVAGTGPGTGGSAGPGWPKLTVDSPLFAGLWEVRGVL